jgi:hypothetical protein
MRTLQNMLSILLQPLALSGRVIKVAAFVRRNMTSKTFYFFVFLLLLNFDAHSSVPIL